jgi:hypothetical protein
MTETTTAAAPEAAPATMLAPAGTIKAKRTAFPTAEAARAAKPAAGKHELYAVSCPDGTTLYVWARGYDSSIGTAARAGGYKAKLLKSPNRDRLAAMIAGLSPEERAALLGGDNGNGHAEANGAAPPADDAADAAPDAAEGKGRKGRKRS